MAKGIVSKNSASSWTDTKIITDGDGIDLDNDRSHFSNTEIHAGSAFDYRALAKKFGLPDDVPLNLLKEALDQVKHSGDPKTIEETKLKSWLHCTNFDMAGWASVVISIGTLLFGK